MKTKSLCLHDSQNKPWLIKLPDNDGVGVGRVRIQELPRLRGWEEAWRAEGTGFLNHSCRSRQQGLSIPRLHSWAGLSPSRAPAWGWCRIRSGPHILGASQGPPELPHTFTEGSGLQEALLRCAPLPRASSSLPGSQHSCSRLALLKARPGLPASVKATAGSSALQSLLET